MRNFGFTWLVLDCIIVCSLTFVMQGTAFGRTRATLLVMQDADSLATSRTDSLMSAAKDSTSDSTVQRSSLKWYSMITNIPGDWVTYYKQKTQRTSIPEFLGLGVLTAGLIITDDATYEVSDRWYKNSKTVSDVSDFFVSLGDGKSQFALAGAFAAYGLIGGDQRALRTGSQIVQAVLASGSVVQLLKHITGRESPFVRSSATGIWRFFPNQLDYLKHVPAYDAFPSGHICTALATVIVIAENYPDTKWIRPVGYVVSGLVGVGMVNRGIHWYSDYPLGLALGYAFGMIAAHPDGIIASASDASKTHVSVAPTMGEQGVGLSMSIVF
ncbi:MAG: phosphatase PAP2 family protein [Ignavibacteriales bacterium]|nr:phosphatase PAP2 family protein [Ignavibacteriales bacterium]